MQHGNNYGLIATKKPHSDTSIIKSSEELLGTRVPPNSLEAEQSVLGAMMINQEAIAKVLEILQPESFYNPANRMIFKTILSLFNKSVSVDALTLSNELKKKNKYDTVGGAVYLSQLSDIMPTAANVDHYARIVQEKYLKREMIITGGKMINSGYDESSDAIEELDKSEGLLFEVAQKLHSKGYSSMKKLAGKASEYIHALLEGKSNSSVKTGYYDLDDLTGGFQKSDLIIVAGRPSMGKTAFALNMAVNISKHNIPIGFFSLEMAELQLVMRILSFVSRVNQNRLRTGKLRNYEKESIMTALSNIEHLPMFIDDSALMTIMELRAKCRRLKSEYNIQAVFVDYLQLLHGPRTESREREISQISSSLKQIAKELDIPVIALAQLNRAVEGRTKKRPMLSDLRESGAIEQDADVVMFVNRPEKNGINQLEDGTPSAGIAEIILGKQRNGPVGEFKLTFKNEYACFENYSNMPEHMGSYQESNEQIDDNDFYEKPLF